MSEQSGLNTPPFGGQHFGTPAGPHYTSQGSPANPSGYAPNAQGSPGNPSGYTLGAQGYPNTGGPIPGYTGADFPAPGGVTTLQPAPAAPAKHRTRLGAVIAASALSAALGVGAGIGSYAYFSGGSIASPITVTTQQA